MCFKLKYIEPTLGLCDSGVVLGLYVSHKLDIESCNSAITMYGLFSFV